MIYKEIHRIIRIVLSGTPSPEESKLFERWFDDSTENQVIFFEMQKIWQERSSEPQMINTDELAEKIWSRSFQNNTKDFKLTSTPFDWQYWSKVAAVILIFITSFFAVYITQNGDLSQSEMAVSKENIVNKIPSGQKSKIILPDGSLVWLNSESSISYNLSEFDSVRRVELKGEAYFEVAKDPEREFRVVSGGLTTIALGTAFNINAHENASEVHISLVEGKVAVEGEGIESEILQPGKALVFDEKSQDIKRSVFDREQILGWKDGVLVFKGESFDDFLIKIKRWYGIEIEVTGTHPASWNIAGHYENVSLKHLLDDVRFTKKFNYKISKNKVNLYFKERSTIE